MKQFNQLKRGTPFFFSNSLGYSCLAVKTERTMHGRSNGTSIAVNAVIIKSDNKSDLGAFTFIEEGMPVHETEIQTETVADPYVAPV